MEIHHYTSIENLALILKNKTIRFTRLDKVDDSEEAGLSCKNIQLSYYTFVSCWTVGPIVKRKVFLYGKCMLVKRCTE